MSRGVVGMRDEWVAQMRSTFFNFPRKNLKTGEIEMHRVQLAMRPIELWECVFPQESLEEFQTMVHHHSGNDGHWGQGLAKTNIALAGLRKMLGAKYLKPLEKGIAMPVDKFIHTPGFGANFIGIKEDRTEAKEEWGYEQEML